MPVRIYDLAKKLGIESKEVIAKAKELGIAGARVPSSSLDKITAEYLESHFTPAKPAAPPAPPPTPEPIVVVTAPPPELPAPIPEVKIESEPQMAPVIPETPPQSVVVEAEQKTTVAEEPPPPPAPPAPRIGELVGRIELPPKLSPRVGDKPGSVRFPARPGLGGRPDLQRGRP